MNKKIVFLAIMMVAALLAACGQDDSTGSPNTGGDADKIDVSWVEQAELPEENGVPDGLDNFATLDLDGNQVDQSIFSDHKITIVDVWGTYCNPCIEAMPVLASIYQKYSDQGVNVVGIVIDVQSADGTPKADFIAKAIAIKDQTGAEFTHILVSDNLRRAIIKDISAIPASFIVDSRGKIISEVAYGGHSEEEWEEIIHTYI